MDRTYRSLFAIILNPIAEAELTLTTIERHARHLAALDRAGKLVLAGPFTDDPAALLILRTKDKDEAIQIMADDPLVQEGLRTFEVKTWLMSDQTNSYMPHLLERD